MNKQKAIAAIAGIALCVAVILSFSAKYLPSVADEKGYLSDTSTNRPDTTYPVASPSPDSFAPEISPSPKTPAPDISPSPENPSPSPTDEIPSPTPSVPPQDTRTLIMVDSVHITTLEAYNWETGHQSKNYNYADSVLAPAAKLSYVCLNTDSGEGGLKAILFEESNHADGALADGARAEFSPQLSLSALPQDGITIWLDVNLFYYIVERDNSFESDIISSQIITIDETLFTDISGGKTCSVSFSLEYEDVVKLCITVNFTIETRQ